MLSSRKEMEEGDVVLLEGFSLFDAMTALEVRFKLYSTDNDIDYLNGH